MNGKAIDAAMLLLKNGGASAEIRRELDLLWKLTHGTIWDTQTDSTEAYQKTVPSGAVAAEIGSIGGETVVWNQLVDTDTEAVTTVSGRKYLTSIGGTDSIITSDGTDISVTGGTDKVFDLTLMYGEGNEPSTTADPRIAAIIAYAETHPEYNAGELKSAEVTEVKSVGKNLLPFADVDFTLNGVRYYTNNGGIYLDGTAIRETSSSRQEFKDNFHFLLRAGSYYFNRGDYPNPVYIIRMEGGGIVTNKGAFVLSEDTEVFLGFYVYQKSFSNLLVHVQLERGSSDTSYAPYMEDTLAIPAAVRALEGYGQSAVGGDGNTLDLSAGTFTEIGHYVDGVWTLLDTPVVTDVSGLLPGNMLEVEAGGTLTLAQAGTELDVPNSVDYLIKLSEVTE